MRSLSSRIGVGGTKLPLHNPCYNRSAIHGQSLVSVFLPGTTSHVAHRPAIYGADGFQNVPNRFPVNARAFHGNVGDTISCEPVCEFQQIPSHGAEAAQLLSSPCPLIWRHPTSHDALVVNIQPTTSFINNTHASSPVSSSRLDAWKNNTLPRVLLRRSGANNPLCQKASQLHCCAGYLRARTQQPLAPRCASTGLAHFHDPL